MMPYRDLYREFIGTFLFCSQRPFLLYAASFKNNHLACSKHVSPVAMRCTFSHSATLEARSHPTPEVELARSVRKEAILPREDPHVLGPDT